MSFTDAIQTVFQKYVVIEGRASRPEFWYWVLFTFLVNLAGNVLGNVIGMGASALVGLFALATIVPSITVGVLRLHDIGRSGWHLLWGLIPVLGLVVMIYFGVQPSQPGTNAYGPQLGGATTEA